MSIARSELTRAFLVVDEWATVREVRDRVEAAGDSWVFVVVRLATGQYAILWLVELIQVLQSLYGGTPLPGMLDTALSQVPNLLAPRAVDPVEQESMGTGQARRLARTVPGKRLVVLEGGEVVGVLEGARMRDAQGVDLDWLRAVPEAYEEAAPVATPKRPGVLIGGEAEEAAGEPSPPVEAEPEERWINAEIEGHDKEKPLRMGQVYTLAFDVDTVVRATSLVTGARFGYEFAEGEQVVDLTVQLESDDFEIHTPPQALRVPRVGRSENKARFNIKPRHEGEGIVNAVFLKDGNFIQVITLRLYTGDLFSSRSLGRPVDAAFAVKPRDLNLTILNTVAGFQLIMSGAVGAMATLPITLEELERWVVEVRQVLQDDIVYMKDSHGGYVYQRGIDIPPEANRAAMQRLARAGYRLYQRIFYGPAADAQANLLGDRLRQMAQRDRLRIQVFSQQFMIPWGVLYVADTYDPDAVSPQMFLGLNHIIEHIPLQPHMQVTDRTIDSRPNLTVSLNVNSDIDEQIMRPVTSEQRKYWRRIRERGDVQVVLRETGDQVTQALADAATSDQVFYFYCHAVSKSLAEGGGPDASTLILSGDGHLTLGDLYLDAPSKIPLDGAPLVFINACESAELSPLFYDGFVPYFMAKGARGVIGTECETPALFAAEWAMRFFDRFLAGEPLGQVFLDLRREFYTDHNNLLGLLYALYVDGDTQIVPGLDLAASTDPSHLEP
jgi:hypothetical protein